MKLFKTLSSLAPSGPPLALSTPSLPLPHVRPSSLLMMHECLQGLLGAVLEQELSNFYKPTALSRAQPHGVNIAMEVFTALTTTRSQRLNIIPQE